MFFVEEHRLDIEEVEHHFGNEQLSHDYHSDYCPESIAHLQLEHALSSGKSTGIEHIEEVRPYED